MLFYDKADPGTAAGRLTAQLLEPYIYDAALLNASLALEIDMQTGKVFSVFYDSEAARLRFGAQPNATDITDRRAAHRRAHSLVGYYAPGLVQSSVPPQREELRIQGAALVNGETLGAELARQRRPARCGIHGHAAARGRRAAVRYPCAAGRAGNGRRSAILIWRCARAPDGLRL